MQNRREFLRNTMLAGAGCLAAGAVRADARWSYCLRTGLPLDTSVYDLATTGCLCELTEKSATNRSQSLDVPDFTRGAWKTAPKMDVVDIDLAHFKI
ncbi:MAG: hypothetical protein IJQ00_02415 [Kiritimatiellae bacterium]|nr:hypothetical protein [Kiritimatiellia bacterium]